VPTFDDAKEDAYYDAANPQNSTLVSGLGVTATVLTENADTGYITVQVTNPAATTP
jgi:hypothetical protein